MFLRAVAICHVAACIPLSSSVINFVRVMATSIWNPNEADSDEEIEEILLLYWYSTKRKVKGKRRWWVHDIIQKRKEYGEYHRLVKELELDEERFYQYFRMSKDQFKLILDLVEPHITKTDTQLRDSITPRERLAICIRYVKKSKNIISSLS